MDEITYRLYVVDKIRKGQDRRTGSHDEPRGSQARGRDVVRWSDPDKADLNAIRDYIAPDSTRQHGRLPGNSSIRPTGSPGCHVSAASSASSATPTSARSPLIPTAFSTRSRPRTTSSCSRWSKGIWPRRAQRQVRSSRGHIVILQFRQGGFIFADFVTLFILPMRLLRQYGPGTTQPIME